MKAQINTLKLDSFKVSCVFMIAVTFTSIGVLRTNTLMIVPGILAIVTSIFLEFLLIDRENTGQSSDSENGGKRAPKKILTKMEGTTVQLNKRNDNSNAA